MAKFEAGGTYSCNDCGMSPIKIIKRTPKTCIVQNENGTQWRMLIKNIDDNEIMTDSKVPKKWQGVFTYNAEYKIDE